MLRGTAALLRCESKVMRAMPPDAPYQRMKALANDHGGAGLGAEFIRQRAWERKAWQAIFPRWTCVYKMFLQSSTTEHAKGYNAKRCRALPSIPPPARSVSPERDKTRKIK